MTDKGGVISEERLSEIIDDSLQWQEAAQTLAYLIGGINGAGAEETLRRGRARLGGLFEVVAHDAACWREIAADDGAPTHVRIFARERAEALSKLVEKAHRRFETRTEGR